MYTMHEMRGLPPWNNTIPLNSLDYITCNDNATLSYGAFEQFDSSDSPDLDSIRSLKSRVSTANKDWLQGFLHAGGVSAILRAMRKRVSHFPRSDLDHGVLMELCETLKASMNTADGLEHVAETEGSIEMLALCLDFQCPPLARLVLEILAVTCYFNKSDLVKVRLQLDPSISGPPGCQIPGVPCLLSTFTTSLLSVSTLNLITQTAAFSLRMSHLFLDASRTGWRCCTAALAWPPTRC